MLNKSQRKRATLVAIFSIYIALNLCSQFYYSYTSLGSVDNVGASFLEMPYASSLELPQKLSTLSSKITNPSAIVVDTTDNSFMQKIEAIEFPTETLAYPALDYIGGLGAPANYKNKIMDALRDREAFKYASTLALDRSRHLSNAEFKMPPTIYGTTNAFRDENFEDAKEPVPKYSLDFGTRESIFNRSSPEASEDVTLVPWREVQNRIGFVNSEFGHTSYVTDELPTSLFGLEADYFIKDGNLAGLGRYLLLRIQNPTPGFRMLLSLTESLQADGVSELPPARIIGESISSFHISGNGSARMISDPVKPRILNGNAYVVLDLGSKPKVFRRRDLGRLFTLYHGEISIDNRLLVGFGRDISGVSSEFPMVGSIPKLIKHNYPVNSTLYSGIYEDGWFSRDTTVLVASTRDDSILTISGTVPQIGATSFATNAQVYVDNKQVGEITLLNGDFEFTSSELTTPGLHYIKMHFAATQNLPNGDGRPVGAKLCHIGFTSLRLLPYVGC